ncbi:MAG: amidohydrolase family protein [Bryobacterales bacterium]|nr:amidohydrolase family protein [Bryobacterales bacterium]MEB2360622.1 amidohydrolase family protein [Bryobacterales bacterium]
MKTYLAYTKITLKLTFRDRVVIFFNYVFPLLFFFMFGQLSEAAQGAAIYQVVSMVLIIGVLGNGFFGAGVRAVQDREFNILRRYKVTPITATPVLVSSLITGWVNYFPSGLMILVLAHLIYGMPWPERWPELLVFLSIGVFAFRAMGLIIASVVNSLQESQIIIQLFYMPMLILSLFPLTSMPHWLQAIAQFLPSPYLFMGMQSILVRREGLAANIIPIVALLVTTLLATFIGVKLFRWEKEEKVQRSSKLWLAAILAPFLLLGAWQFYSRDNIVKARILERQMYRDRTWLIRNVRIFAGDGTVIPAATVLIRGGRIDTLYPSEPPGVGVKAETIEGAGKTLLPGLIDARVHLIAPGGVYETPGEYEPHKTIRRALAAYLYSGVTVVRSVGDPLELVEGAGRQIASGERLGAEVFTTGPVFTAPEGLATAHFDSVPQPFRDALTRTIARTPASVEQARQEVKDLAGQGVQAIEAILESGVPARAFPRLDPSILKAIIVEAHARSLPVVVHTGDSRDVREAVEAGADAIAHGSARDEIPDEIWRAMARRKVMFTPSLVAVEALQQIAQGSSALLERSLAQQVGPAPLLRATEDFLVSGKAVLLRGKVSLLQPHLKIAMTNLERAYKAGVPLVAGSDAGNLLVTHGPAVHRELQLWVEAGVPARDALTAATGNAAAALRASDRLGLIRPGCEASMLLVDGNPLEEIAATERISAVFFRGERLDRASLFKQGEN